MSDAPETTAPTGFEALGLKPQLLAALTALGYEEPTPIQQATMPPLLEGRDVMGQAATGTGKTAAFALPILNRITIGANDAFRCSALVLVPTRELAMQVAEAVHSYGKTMGVSVVPVYGGQEIFHQLKMLKRGVDVVVATPGRALDHLRRKSLKLDKVQTVVLDEADEMLDLGFADDLEAILSELPKVRQTALFSATIPSRIAAIAGRHLKSPVRIQIESKGPLAGALPKIAQVAHVVPQGMKDLALGRLLDAESPERAIIFCRTRVEVERLAQNLASHGYDVAALHGGIDQDKRDRILRRFKQKEGSELLVATDVAARGLHVDNLSHVFNFDLPTSPEVYVHRIGRTGRAGAEGRAISLLEPREHRLLKNIERFTRTAIAVERLPTVADLQARRLGLTKSTIASTLAAGNLDSYRGVVEELATTAELMDVAAAAVAALHQQLAPAGGEEADIPEWKPGKAERQGPGARPDAASRRGEPPSRAHAPRRSAPRGVAPASRPDAAPRRSAPAASARPEAAPRRSAPAAARAEAPPRRSAPRAGAAASRPDATPRKSAPRVAGPAARDSAPSPAPHQTRAPRPDAPARPAGRAGPFARLFITVGQAAGVTPADFVGAIANEAGLTSRDIGAIQISENHSIVEVSEHRAVEVIDALRATTLRGRRVRVDFDRNTSGPRRRS